jgi:hypothetical protein
MGEGDLVIGLIRAAGSGGLLAEKSRDLSIAWSRYGYRDSIIERDSIAEILAEASRRGHRHCLVLAPGVLIRESWRGEGESDRDFLGALAHWVESNDFFVAGRIVEKRDAWYGLDTRWLLVDLARHAELGCPEFGDEPGPLQELPRAQPKLAGGQIRSLEPTDATLQVQPGLEGWGFIAAALRAGLPVQRLDPTLENQLLDLGADDEPGAERFAGYLGDGIRRYMEERETAKLSAAQSELLDTAALHFENARRGVFLWNIEPYDDVEKPPPDFADGVSHIYSVAAGFKPNRILETHGFDSDTVVTFFDYSERALELRRYTVDRWDGQDYPRFVRELFERFPYPETYYHLWRDRTPEQVSPAELESAWRRELGRWGGEQAFAAHWSRYRELSHEFVHCDIVGAPAPLFDGLAVDPRAVMWWSNAFFTVHSNWHYLWDERRDRYESWVSELASRNPELLIYGSDHDNSNVNWIRIGDYWNRYRELPGDELVPRKLSRHEIRM